MGTLANSEDPGSALFAKTEVISREKNTISVGNNNLLPLDTYNEPSQVNCIILSGRTHQYTKGHLTLNKTTYI